MTLPTPAGAPALTQRLPAGKSWLPLLEVLRGLAAAAVVAHHCYDLSGAYSSSWGWLLEGFGEWGVDLFFVLSAFLLSEFFWRQPRSARSLRVFFVRRAFRIIPPYYAMLIPLLLFFAQPAQLHSSQGRRQVIADLTFTQWLSPYTASNLNVNGVLWTLTLEVMLYGTLPLLAWLVAKQPIAFGLALIALGLAYRVWVCHSADGLIAYVFDSGRPNEQTVRLYMVRQYLGILPVFAIGVLARRLTEHGVNVAAFLPQARRFPLIALVALLAPSIVLQRAIYLASDFRNTFWFVAFDPLLGLSFVPVLLLAAGAAPDRVSLLFRAGQWLGARSYSLYLWHFPIILSVFGMGPLILPPAHTHYWLRIAAVVGLSLLFADVGYRVIELPGIRAGQRLARKLGGRTPAPGKRNARLHTARSHEGAEAGASAAPFAYDQRHRNALDVYPLHAQHGVEVGGALPSGGMVEQ